MKKAVKHFPLKKMVSNDDSIYNYLNDEYDKAIDILKTFSNANVKQYSDVFHFVVHYVPNYSEQECKEYSIVYKKLISEAGKAVGIKKHS